MNVMKRELVEPLQAERFAEVADLHLLHARQGGQPDVQVARAEVAVGEVDLGDPQGGRADVPCAPIRARRKP